MADKLDNNRQIPVFLLHRLCQQPLLHHRRKAIKVYHNI